LKSKYLVVLAFLFAAAAQAHKPSDSYLALSVDGTALRGQWDIALRDLEFAIGLDADGNGEITWGELKARQRSRGICLFPFKRSFRWKIVRAKRGGSSGR
jgi:hypothetical protein